VRNRYVDLAVERTRKAERARAADERERLQTEHTAELERVRTAAAGEAMERLADVLLGLDLAPPTARAPAAAAARAVADAVPALAEGAVQASSAAAEELEAGGCADAWIDTPLCTSCNDCLKLNPLLFLYNEDKQAVLGDLRAGSFAQLVEAAELCPAKCIHPGLPQDPQQPGLDELVARAAPFNR
jgi:ferredoxin